MSIASSNPQSHSNMLTFSQWVIHYCVVLRFINMLCMKVLMEGLKQQLILR